MLRRIPGLRALLRRRRLARLIKETPQRSAAEHTAALSRLIEQARAER
ncbi:hypothetical protein ACQPZX_29360 [Actinoplanes sp. CA-142083]